MVRLAVCWRLKPQLHNQSPPTRTNSLMIGWLNRTVLGVVGVASPPGENQRRVYFEYRTAYYQ
jgi:hypothetical protein